MAPPELQPGVIFADDYRVVSLLGCGGMGAVYVADQLSTGKQRALKLIQPHVLGRDPNARARFTQEATIASRIASEHVVQVVGGGVAGDTPWLAMELLEGETLCAMTDRLGPLRIEDIRPIVEQLTHGLGAAHSAGIVHRDLKPANIFIAVSRRVGARLTVKLLDFGISKVMAHAGTLMTTPMGTPGWMAPEQMHKGVPVGPYTDVWALGLILFWLLTGHSYWVSEESQLSLLSILNEMKQGATATARERAVEYGCTRLIPLSFDGWFARCVALDGAARFQHAAAAYAELKPVLMQVVDRGPAVTTHVTPVSHVITVPGSMFTIPVRPLPVDPVAPRPPVNIATSRPSTGPSAIQHGPGRTKAYVATGIASTLTLLAVVSWFAATRSDWWAARQCENGSARITPSNAASVATACAAACTASPGHACVAEGETVLRFHLDGGSQRAHDSFQKACLAGDATACRRLAQLSDSDPRQAATLYEQSCKNGDAAACADQGALLESASPADEAGASALYDRACAAGAALGCAYQGLTLFDGRSGKRDKERGAQTLRKAIPPLDQACKDDGAACVARVAAGELLGGDDRAPGAEALYRAACDHGFGLGCANLAVAQVLGLGSVAPAVQQGMDSLQRMCADGHSPPACANAGALLSGADLAVRYGPRGAVELKFLCGDRFLVGCSGWESPVERPASLAVHEGDAAQDIARACDSGDSNSCVNLGAMQCAGLGVDRDCAAARVSFKRACDNGEFAGCGELGESYHEGIGGDVRSEGTDLLGRACEAGELDSCAVRADASNARDTLLHLCEADHVAMACADYGDALAAGRGGSQDVPTGLAFLTRAATGEKLDRPYPGAYLGLGHFETNPDKSASYYREACDHHVWSGCAERAVDIANGKEGAKDLQRASQLLTNGCDAHDASSCFYLAIYSLNNQGPLSKAAAVEQLGTTCIEGAMAEACAEASKYYRAGFAGHPPDSARASSLRARACDLGEKDSCQPQPTPTPTGDRLAFCRAMTDCVSAFNLDKNRYTEADMGQCNAICANAKR